VTLRVREGVALAPLTSLRLGGPARYLAEAADAVELREALAWAGRRSLPVQLLGGGTNTVFPDRGFEGLVIHLGDRGLAFEEAGDEATLVRVRAGTDWDDVARAAVERGLAGIECLSGIPGAAGAAPLQNIGAYGQELGDTLAAVTCLRLADGQEVRIPAAECGLGYRTSRFKAGDRGRFAILELELELARGAEPTVRYPELTASLERGADLSSLEPPAALAAVRDHVLALRRAKSMLLDPEDPDARSAGSFFLNPVLAPEAFGALARRHARAGAEGPVPSFPAPGGVKVPAAWLVEQAGFRKGERHGGVGISSAHALALVNRDGTTAELLELAGRIREAVRGRFGVELEIEPDVVDGAGR